MSKETARRLFKIIALFSIITAEIVLSLFLVPPGWIALASGFVGSLILIVPPMRIELAKAARSRIYRLGKPYSPALTSERKESEEGLTKEIDEENEWDAYLLIVGGALLAFYFVLQIPYKMELVSKDELSREFTRFRIEQVDPLKDHLRR